MAVTEIPWDDGSGGKIYLTYPSASGAQIVSVSSDANTGSARTKTVTFRASGVSPITLTVNQIAAPQQYTLSVNPSSNTASGTVSNPNNAYASETSTSYAQMAVSKTSGATSYIYFKFDTSSIPANATIDSVECKAKAYMTVTSNITPRIGMYSGTTAKGNAQTLTTSASTFTFSGETWSRNEVSDVRVRVSGTRNSGSSTSYMRFYGATLTVTYTV